MNKDEFIKNIKKFKVNICEDILKKLDIYIDFLKEYNNHTNITRITSDEDIYLKHFYDSLTILKEVDLNKYNNLIDVGSGAGFPGVVLKIFYPHLEVTLLDSNNKKTKFLNMLQEKLNIELEIINDRVENYAKNNLNKYDIVTARAVADLRILSELTLPLVKEEGLFIALKGNIEEEINNALKTIDNLDSKIIKIETFYLFNNENLRNIIVIQKNNKTNINMLRPYNKIIKTELKKNNK